MGRLLRKYNRSRRATRMARGSLSSDGLGSLGDVGQTISTVFAGATAAIDVASDPYAAEVLCRVKQLYQIEHKQPVQECITTPSGLTGGVGLRYAVIPMRGVVYAQQHKWAYAVAAAVILGVPFLAGYMIGSSGRKSTP